MKHVLYMRLSLYKPFVARNGDLTRLHLYIGPLQTHQEDNVILGLLKISRDIIRLWILRIAS